MSVSEKEILDAALEVFSLYGFRKATMGEIASRAGVSRPTLYSRFSKKEQIFCRLSVLLQEQALERARQCDDLSLTVGERLTRVMEEFHGTMYRLISSSPHGLELIDQNQKLAGEATTGVKRKFERLLLEIFTDSVSDAEQRCFLMEACIEGIKTAELSPEEWSRKVGLMCRLFSQT